jgi:UDP:flavonoid glycosyltransferase YjiC (YdhE family)
MMNWNRDREKPLLLIFPFEQLAHYLRCLVLAKNLAPHFEIRVAHSDAYAAFIQQEGFETFSCAGMDAVGVLACVKKFDFSWLNSTSLQQSFSNHVAAIENLQPDVVLGDTVPTLSMAAEKTGVPCIQLMNGYMSKHFAGMRKMSWRYPLYNFLSILPESIFDQLTKKGERLSFHKIHQPFKALRQQHGLSKKMFYPDELEGNLNLLCDLPYLFPQQHLPESYVHTPPLLYASDKSSNALVHQLDPAKKTIFVSMGSTGDWEQVAFLNNAYYRRYNIVTAGDVKGVVQGPQVIRSSFANPEPLFQHVDLVLCHGGNGTIYQALRYGIPLLCKTAHFEQEWNVQALEQKGLGASLDGITRQSGFQKQLALWIDKKGSAPLQLIQEQLRATADFTPVVNRIRELLQLEAQTLYINEVKQTA